MSAPASRQRRRHRAQRRRRWRHSHDFHPVDNSSLLSDKALALAVGSLGIFILDCRNSDHLAVTTSAAQPTEKGAFEQLGVETVGLGASVFTRYRYASCVDNVGLDAACSE